MKKENITAGSLILCVLLSTDVINAKNNNNEFELPPLSYAENALEPYISERTIQFHYGKHLAAYIANTNKLKKGTEFENMQLQEIVRKAEGGLFNNAAQTFNHLFYFESLRPAVKDNLPTGEILRLIEKNFGSFDKFKDAFSNKALTLFGSGWTWLTLEKDDTMEILQTSNADTPIAHGKFPLLTIDVWEHAYYLDTQNNRGKYIEGYWNIIDWDAINKRIEQNK